MLQIPLSQGNFVFTLHIDITLILITQLSTQFSNINNYSNCENSLNTSLRTAKQFKVLHKHDISRTVFCLLIKKKRVAHLPGNKALSFIFYDKILIFCL